MSGRAESSGRVRGIERIADLLRLVRAPLAPTTTGDVLVGLLCMGSYAARDPIASPRTMAALILSSACLYAFGMATNDIYDRDRDRRLHPERPIPSGRIRLGTAWIAACIVLLGGLFLSGVVGIRGRLAAIGIVVLILLYNRWLKRYVLIGSLVMASIRGLNVIYGWTAREAPLRWEEAADFAPVLCIFGYIFFTTLLSTAEDDNSRSRVSISLIAIALIAAAEVVRVGPGLIDPIWLLLIFVAPRAIRSVDRSPRATAETVRYLLFGLYFLYAHFLIAAHRPFAALIVLSLALPSLLLSRLLRQSS